MDFIPRSSPLPTVGIVSPFPPRDYVPTPSPLECVEPHERAAAEMVIFERFKEACGKYPPHVAGYNVLLRVYQRDAIKIVKGHDGEEVELTTRSDAAVRADKYQSVVHMVVGMGPEAYRGNNFDGTPRFPGGPWCAVGDFVLVGTYSGLQFSYGDPKRGAHNFIPLIIAPDDKILCKIHDPQDVVATHVIDRESL